MQWLEDRRLLAGAEIHGTKWHDLDQDGQIDGGESGLSGWTIFLDDDGDGELDGGETSTTTNSSGDYSFTGLVPGTYQVGEVQQAGWTQTFPFIEPDLDFVIRYQEGNLSGGQIIDGLNGAEAVYVSPDGAHVYTASILEHSVVAFERDVDTGLLTYITTYFDNTGPIDGLRQAHWIEASDDGQHLYVSGRGDDAIVHFSRNETTGELTFEAVYEEGVGGVTGLDGAGLLDLTADGQYLYATGKFGDSLAVFSRNTTDGTLTFVTSYTNGVGGITNMNGPRGISVSPDGEHVYVSTDDDDSLLTFDRDTGTGLLTFVNALQDGVGGVDGLDGALNVRVGPDGNQVYVTGSLEDTVSVFDRNPTTGVLTQTQVFREGVGGVTGIDGAIDQAFSPDGRRLYVASFFGDSVAVFSRDTSTGALTYETALFDNTGGIDGLDGAHGVFVSPDSQNVYVGSFMDDAAAVFEIPPQQHTVTLAVDEIVNDIDFGNFDTNPATNQAPVLDPIGNQGIDEGSLLTFTATATDPDVGDQLTFSLDAGAPAAASIDPNSGVFTWTPVEADGFGVFNVTVRVTDDGAPVMDDFETITITVNEVNQAPVLDPVGNKNVDEGTLLTFTATASDADLPANQLTFSLDAGAPAAASIDPNSGVFTWTPAEADGFGVFNVTVRVTDDGTPAMDDFETISITVNEVNAPPVLDPIGNQNVDEGSLLTFTATASDPDLPANQLTYSLDAGAPAGASIDSLSGVFNWTPAEADGFGVFNVTVRVTDDGTPAMDDFETISITVNEVNAPPVLDPIGNQNVDEGTLLTFIATASDPDLPANQLTFSLDPGAPAAANINPLSGVFTWTPTEADGFGVFNVTVRVTDDGTPAMDDFETISITVNEVNAPPVLDPIGNQNVDEGSLLNFTVTASDPDLPANQLTYSLDAGAPAGASIDALSGVFTWTPSESDGGGVFNVTVRVTDDGTPTLDDFETISITVNDTNVAPVLDPIGNQSVDEGSLLTFTATASDADLPADQLTFSLGPGAPAGASIDSLSGVFTWTPDDSVVGPVSIEIIVADDGTPTMSDSETIDVTVNNVAPTASIAGTTDIYRGETVTFTLTANDPSPVDQAGNFTFEIDWDGDSIVDENVVGPSGSTVQHTFSDVVSTNIQVRATDKDGGTGSFDVTPYTVNPFVLRPDGGGNTDLIYGGTELLDGIFFFGNQSNLIVFTQIEALALVERFDNVGSAVTGKVIVYGYGFDDILAAEFLQGVPIEIHGGAGNDILVGSTEGDVIFGGEGHDLLLGGDSFTDGDDTLYGGNGNDVLFGHFGADQLFGEAGGDLLVGDQFTFTNLSQGFLRVHQEWISAKPYATRVANILTGGGLNDPYTLTPTVNVIDDGAVDTLDGGLGDLDWFFYTFGQDIAADPEAGETETDADP